MRKKINHAIFHSVIHPQQVLVGHSDAVLTVAVSVTNKSQVLSGSKDCNLILWDLHTGEEIHTLAGHLAPVMCVRVSADGKIYFEM